MTRQKNTKSSKIEKSNSSRASLDTADEVYLRPIEVDEAGHGKALTPSNDRQSDFTNIKGSRSSEKIYTKETDISIDIKQENNDLVSQSKAIRSKAIRSSEKNTRKETFISIDIKKEGNDLNDRAQTYKASQNTFGSGYIMPIDIDEHSNDSAQAFTDVRLSKVTKSKSSKSFKKHNANEDVFHINEDEDQDATPAADDRSSTTRGESKMSYTTSYQ